MSRQHLDHPVHPIAAQNCLSVRTMRTHEWVSRRTPRLQYAQPQHVTGVTSGAVNRVLGDRDDAASRLVGALSTRRDLRPTPIRPRCRDRGRYAEPTGAHRDDVDRYRAVVSALLDVRPDHAGGYFDEALDAALAANRVDVHLARTLRWWQRASVRAAEDFVAQIIPSRDGRARRRRHRPRNATRPPTRRPGNRRRPLPNSQRPTHLDWPQRRRRHERECGRRSPATSADDSAVMPASDVRSDVPGSPPVPIWSTPDLRATTRRDAPRGSARCGCPTSTLLSPSCDRRDRQHADVRTRGAARRMPTLRLLPELEEALRQVPGIRAVSVVTGPDAVPDRDPHRRRPGKGREAGRARRAIGSDGRLRHRHRPSHRQRRPIR